MDYTDESVSEIVIQYNLLRDTINTLQDVRKKGLKVDLGFIAETYMEGVSAGRFLQEIPATLREKLKLGELEGRLQEFGHFNINL